MRFLSLLALVWFAGCATHAPAGRSAPESRSAPLLELNERLSKGVFTIILTDSTVIERAERITVGADETVFYRQMPDSRDVVRTPVASLDRVLTARIASIWQRPQRQTKRGAWAGAIPGLAMIALSAGVLLADQGESYASLGALGVGIQGVLVAGAGALIGGSIGSQVRAGPTAKVYEAPLSRYFTPD